MAVTYPQDDLGNLLRYACVSAEFQRRLRSLRQRQQLARSDGEHHRTARCGKAQLQCSSAMRAQAARRRDRGQ